MVFTHYSTIKFACVKRYNSSLIQAKVKLIRLNKSIIHEHYNQCWKKKGGGVQK